MRIQSRAARFFRVWNVDPSPSFSKALGAIHHLAQFQGFWWTVPVASPYRVMVLPGAAGCQTESPVLTVWRWPSGCSGVFLRRPKTVLAITLAFGCLPELDGKTLLLKTAHTFVTGYGEIKLVLSGKRPSFLIGHQHWKVLCGLLWGEKSSINLPSCELYTIDSCAQYGTSIPKVIVYANASLSLGRKTFCVIWFIIQISFSYI